MSYHIVSIDSPQCSITCKDGQLICKNNDGEQRKLPLEDVASIIITSFSASIHSNLFLEAAKQGVALIICESFKPVSLVLPANRSTDTLLTRRQISLPDKQRLALWQKTIDAKTRNQYSVAAQLAPEDASLPLLKSAMLSKKMHKEAVCAKLFWQIFGRSQNAATFTRERYGGGFNALLNYGYAVLLSIVLQKLLGVGIDPTFGISHVVREKSAPLAYDLMEPFRPCVDWKVVQWIQKNPETQEWLVTTPFRKWITSLPLEKTEYLSLELELQGCIEGVIRSFRKALLAHSIRYYQPWTLKNSKWDGSL